MSLLRLTPFRGQGQDVTTYCIIIMVGECAAISSAPLYVDRAVPVQMVRRLFVPLCENLLVGVRRVL
jgi:hypothetical protein